VGPYYPSLFRITGDRRVCLFGGVVTTYSLWYQQQQACLFLSFFGLDGP
jgi:hypothetical protein